MKCPYCLKEMRKGEVKIGEATFNIFNSVTWYPEEELNKKIRKEYIHLNFNAESYYCDECMKVVSIFDEK